MSLYLKLNEIPDSNAVVIKGRFRPEADIPFIRNQEFKQSRKFKMKIYPSIFYLLLFLSNCAHAQLPRDCSDASQKLLEAEVQQGNPKAQYLLGTQLLTGQMWKKR
ncbi:hypothetical protein [Herbaspirillum huttiense]|uniref:hypothetical protein n=1 Tax=Herbaspirillum huttiense TaxID=863372 RepID=UPI0031E19CD0